MGCMKCGKKLGESQVFCDECLAEMEKRPVKPGTVVKLPKRTSSPPAKKRSLRHRYFWDAEDQIDNLRMKLRWTTAAFVIALIGLLVCIVMLLWLLKSQGRIDFPFLCSSDCG